MLILAAILGILVYGIVAATWGTLNSTLGFNDAQNGSIALAQALGLVVASISVGPLIDLKGKKVALVGGLALIAGSLFWLPTAGGDYTTTLICLAVLGLGGGIVVTGANALVSDVTESRRGTALNLLNLFFGLGGLLTPFVTANLLNGDAIRMCYLAAALAAVVLVVNVVTPMPRPTGERGFKVSELGAVFGRPALYLLSLVLFLYVACEVGVWNWLARYLIDERGLDKAAALNILSLGFALGLLVGRVAVARILVNVSSLTVTLIASCAMAATTYGMPRCGRVRAAAEDLHGKDPEVRAAQPGMGRPGRANRPRITRCRPARAVAREAVLVPWSRPRHPSHPDWPPGSSGVARAGRKREGRAGRSRSRCRS